MYTYENLKGYYSFYTFANLYEMGTQVESICEDKDVYVVASTGNGKYGIAVTYYAENDNEGAKKVTLDIEGYDATKLKFYLVDEANTYAPKTTYKIEDNKITMRLERNSIVYIEG